MKTAELRAKNKEELKDLVLSLKKEQFNLRFQDATGSLESRSRFKEIRRTIARAHTLITEEAMGKKVAPKKEAPAKKESAKKEKAAPKNKETKAAKTKKEKE